MISLREKIGYVDSWQIRDKEDVHPSHRVAVVEISGLEECLSAVRYRISDYVISINRITKLIGVPYKKDDYDIPNSKVRKLIEKAHKEGMKDCLQIIKEELG